MRPAAHYGFNNNNDSNNNGFAVGPTWPRQSTVVESAKAIYFHLRFNSLPSSLPYKLLPGVLVSCVVRESFMPLQELKGYFPPLI